MNFCENILYYTHLETASKCCVSYFNMEKNTFLGMELNKVAKKIIMLKSNFNNERQYRETFHILRESIKN